MILDVRRRDDGRATDISEFIKRSLATTPEFAPKEVKRLRVDLESRPTYQTCRMYAQLRNGEELRAVAYRAELRHAVTDAVRKLTDSAGAKNRRGRALAYLALAVVATCSALGALILM